MCDLSDKYPSSSYTQLTAIAAAAVALLTVEADVGQLQHSLHTIHSFQQNLLPAKLRVGEARGVAPAILRSAANLLLRAIWQPNDQHLQMSR
jgi:hypothetical protein